jgi:hypothetical protein
MSTIKLLKRLMIILLSGRPASGKSVEIRAIVRQICETPSLRPAFGKFYVSTKFSNDYAYVPDECIHENFSEEHLGEHIQKIKRWKKTHPTQKVPNNLLVIDDSMGHLRWYSSFWSNLISTHRHWGTIIILASQSLTSGEHGSSILMRNCVDMAVLYHRSFIQSHKNIYNSFGGWFPSIRNLLHASCIAQRDMASTGLWFI